MPSLGSLLAATHIESVPARIGIAALSAYVAATIAQRFTESMPAEAAVIGVLTLVFMMTLGTLYNAVVGET
jgi:hypothetical protein